MSLRLPPFISIVFKKSERTEKFIEVIRKRHEELIAAIKPQLSAGDEVPCFISEDESLFVDIIGDSPDSLQEAINHAQACGLTLGKDFVSLNYIEPDSELEWLSVVTKGGDRYISSKVR